REIERRRSLLRLKGKATMMARWSLEFTAVRCGGFGSETVKEKMKKKQPGCDLELLRTQSKTVHPRRAATWRDLTRWYTISSWTLGTQDSSD
ncbi:hypothetical protein L195_g039325, partial [Trifolium pratense]